MNIQTTEKPVLMERLGLWLKKQFWENRVPLTAALVFGILAYAFAFTNKLINHDEAGQLFAKGATVTSGRWGLGAMDLIFPNFSMPWIYGILTIFMVAAAICVMLRIFAIRSSLLQILLAGTVMVFPSLIGLFGYMFTSSSYALSFLLAVIAVWCLKQGRLWWIPALGCMVLSLSIYQSYIAIAAVLLVLLLIQALLRGEEALPVLKRGIAYVAFLVLSLGLYYGATQVILRLKGVEFSAYAADSITLQPSTLINGVILAYQTFFAFFATSRHGLVPTSFSSLVHIAMLAACAVLLFLWLLGQKKRSPLQLGLLLVLVGLLPLAVNCMYLITAENSIHTLVLYGFAGVYLLAGILADAFLEKGLSGKAAELLRRGCLNLILLCLALVIAVNTYIANEAYLNMHLRYENAYGFYTTLLAELQTMPEFQADTPVAIVGEYTQPEHYGTQFRDVLRITGVHGFQPDNYSKGAFLKYYLGMELPLATDDQCLAISQTEVYQQMPVYPYHGSVAYFDGMLVVKLS